MKRLKMEVIVEHQLSQEEALRRIKKLIEEMKEEHLKKAKDFKEEWANSVYKFSFSYKRFYVSGSIVAEPSRVGVNLDLPGIARLFKKKIKTAIRERLEKELG